MTLEVVQECPTAKEILQEGRLSSLILLPRSRVNLGMSPPLVSNLWLSTLLAALSPWPTPLSMNPGTPVQLRLSVEYVHSHYFMSSYQAHDTHRARFVSQAQGGPKLAVLSKILSWLVQERARSSVSQGSPNRGLRSYQQKRVKCSCTCTQSMNRKYKRKVKTPCSFIIGLYCPGEGCQGETIIKREKRNCARETFFIYFSPIWEVELMSQEK